MNTRSIIVALATSLFFTNGVLADTETVNGITWIYTVSNDEVSVVGGYSSSTAVPESISGAIVIPSTLCGYPVTSIGDYAFYQCNDLMSVTIPESVTSIGDFAFHNCIGLTSVTIPNSVTSIADGAFSSCTGLTSVTIGDGVTNIGNQAFENCWGLTSVTIPDSVTNIGFQAFYYCLGLTSVTIGDGVTSIGWSAFSDCPSLMFVTIGDGVTSIDYHAFYNCTGLTSVTIGNSVTSIENHAFYNCTGLTSVTIPNSVTSIGEGAFECCKSLTSVTIGTGVTSIGWCAFQDCIGLTSVTIPDSVTRIGGNTFARCSGLQTVYLPRQLEGQTSSSGLGLSCPIVFYDKVSLAVSSVFGEPTPNGENTYYTTNHLCDCSVAETAYESGSLGVQYHCTGWTGTGSAPASGTGTNCTFFIEEDSSITWLWETNVFIECSISGICPPFATNEWRRLGGDAFAVPLGRASESLVDATVSGDADGVVADYSERAILIPSDRPRSVLVKATVVGFWEAAGGAGAPVTLESAGAAQWRVVADESSTDGYRARSGDIPAGGVSAIETTLAGPGTLSFKWRISAGRGDFARVYLDGVPQQSITRSADWATAELDILAGEHTVRWSYERGSGSAAGEDATFLDDVNWRPQVSLSVASAFGTASPATGTHTLVYGDEVLAVAAEPEATEGTRHVCAGWTGTGSAPASGTEASVSFTITNDSSIVWNWRPEHWTQVSVSGGSADFEAQWIVAGETVEIPLAPATHLYEIALWGDTGGVTLDGTTLRFTADRPRQIAVTITEVKVSLMVESAHSFPSPTNGVHALSWGAEVAAGVAEPEPASGVQFRCTGWTGTGDVPAGGEGTNCTFTIEGDSSIRWNWQTNVWISLTLSGPATTDFTNQWILLGGSVVASFTVSAFHYALALSGDTDGVVFDDTNLTLSIPADKPRYLSLAVSGLTLAGALDTPGLSWTTDGSAAWFPQYAVSHDGAHAVRSGEVLGDDYCGLETTLSGSGTLSWFWRLDSGSGGNSGVDVLLDGVWLSAYEPTGEWTEESLEIGDGEHTIRFEFWNAGTEATISDCAYIDQVSWTPSAIVEAIPSLQGNSPQAVTNAIESAGFADAAAVMDAIGGDAEKYSEFKAWAQTVKGGDGNVAGEAAVVDSPHAAVSWLLGAEALFENEPEIRIASLALANAQGSGNGEQGTAVAMTVTIEVKDGEDIVKVAEEKVAAMFEATSDLRDWDGAAKLSPTVSGATRNADNTMTFTVIPGDGTAKSAFMRVKVK